MALLRLLRLAVVVLLFATVGCSRTSEPLVLVIPLRDDAEVARVNSLSESLSADPRVQKCEFVGKSILFDEGRPPEVSPTDVVVGGGDPTREAYLRVELRPRSSRQDLQAVRQRIENRPDFSQLVYLPDIDNQ